MLEIHQLFTHNHLRNFTYLLETSNHDFYVVDPWEASEVMSFIEARQGKLLGIINTHEHSDHTRGNAELLKKTGCALYAHENAAKKIIGVTHYFEADELLAIDQQSSLKVLDTPGHTMAHLCLLVLEDTKPIGLICGDTLFNAGVGNCHNGGDPETLFETITHKIANLPDDVLVYPGHDYLENNLRFTLDREPSNELAQELLIEKGEDFLITTIGLEKEINTFFRLACSEVREGLGFDDSMSDKEVFLELRKRRNSW